MGVLSGVDRAQRRFPPLGVPIAVFYKFYDDQGNYLVAALTYYAFVAIFPLLLLASSILGFILQGRPQLQETVLNSALAQFPIIGDRLGRPEELQGGVAAVVIGSLVALFGASGLGQAIQNAMNTAWAVPRNSRPNPIMTRFKSLLLLTMAGLAVLAVSVGTTLLANTEVFGVDVDDTLRWLIRLASIGAVGLVLTGLGRLAAARHHYVGATWPGAFVVASLWQVLQHLGTVYATTVLVGTEGMNETFALVLGLMGLIYIAAIIGVLGIEINVVLARRLWPRSLLTLFTDNVDLTDADRRTYAGLVHMNALKGFESVAVRFDERNGDTHEIVLEPKTPPNGVLGVVPQTEAGSKTKPAPSSAAPSAAPPSAPLSAPPSAPLSAPLSAPPSAPPADPQAGPPAAGESDKTQPIRRADQPGRSGTNR